MSETTLMEQGQGTCEYVILDHSNKAITATQFAAKPCDSDVQDDPVSTSPARYMDGSSVCRRISRKHSGFVRMINHPGLWTLDSGLGETTKSTRNFLVSHLAIHDAPYRSIIRLSAKHHRFRR